MWTAEYTETRPHSSLHTGPAACWESSQSPVLAAVHVPASDPVLGVYEIHITPCSTMGALGDEGGALGGGSFSGESGGSSA